MAETKAKPESTLRTPKAKKKLGLSVPSPLRLPHDDLIHAENKLTDSSRTSQTSQTSPTRQTQPIAPERDYTKVANSINRQAVPAGVFAGKSKQLYDCLYAMTRGAIVPVRTTRISRPKLMKKSHIGSRVTFDANIERLMTVGLIEVRQIVGEHEGNEYTVNLPEEINLTLPSMTSQTSLTRYAQKVDRLVGLESSQTRHTLSLTDSIVSENPKTSFKTKEENLDDDAALAGLNEALTTINRELTGKDLSRAEADRWRELADVLIAELRIAAARTTVSSVPSFLAEHLRRRLWKIDKKQARAEGRELPDQAVASAMPTEQAKDCADCGGSGWWYPEGTEKGVAKCKHSKMSQS